MAPGSPGVVLVGSPGAPATGPDGPAPRSPREGDVIAASYHRGAPEDRAPAAGGWDHEADRWLVDQVAGGHSAAVRSQAFEVLLRRHQDRIYRIALRMTGDPSDAEDIAQDVAVQLWRVMASFTGASTFSTWLYRIVVNRCSDDRRARRAPTRDTSPLAETDHPSTAGPEQRVVDAARLDAAAAALAALPEDQRAALVLCQMEGLSYREAAAITDVSEAALRSRLERARRNLVAAMREWA